MKILSKSQPAKACEASVCEPELATISLGFILQVMAVSTNVSACTGNVTVHKNHLSELHYEMFQATSRGLQLTEMNSL